MKGQVLSAALIAFSIVVLGFAIKGGIDNFVNKDHKVTVKGLSEKEKVKMNGCQEKPTNIF